MRKSNKRPWKEKDFNKKRSKRKRENTEKKRDKDFKYRTKTTFLYFWS
jgi:hypothetical protein